MAQPTIDKEKYNVLFYDGFNNETTWSHYVPIGTAFVDMDDLYTALAACSSLAAEGVSFTYSGADPGVNAVAGAFAVVEETASLLFDAADGSVVVVSVPGPKAGCFAADNKTVNPVNAQIAALIVEILLIVVTKGGALLVEYVRGYKKGRKARKTKPGVTFNATA